MVWDYVLHVYVCTLPLTCSATFSALTVSEHPPFISPPLSTFTVHHPLPLTISTCPEPQANQAEVRRRAWVPVDLQWAVLLAFLSYRWARHTVEEAQH